MPLATPESRQRTPAAVDAPLRPERSDACLLAGFARSDPEATAAFVERFRRRVFWRAFAVLGESAAAEDVAQEAMLRAWRRAAMFDSGRGSVVTWLLTITRNLAIDATRVRTPAALDPEDLLGMSSAHSEWNPADVVDIPDGADRLRKALAELTDEQRRAVVLGRAWGLSDREVSEREQIPLGTAKTRIHFALRRLRAALTEEEARAGSPHCRSVADA
jgi:RNA polymerase sigma-70 factor (ECF subfamily)